MADEIVYTSKSTIERVRGPIRRAYLPQTKVLTVSLPAATTVSDLSDVPDRAVPISEQGRLAQIITSASIWVTVGVFFDLFDYAGVSGVASSDSARVPIRLARCVHLPDLVTIKKGDVVCTLESMKMQVAVKAHKDGVIQNLKIKESATVAKGDVIADIE